MPEKRLTKEIAEQFVYLSEFTELDDDAAESFSKHVGDLDLDGLTSLSDAAAESLSRQKGNYLYLNGLPILSDAAAESLSRYDGELQLSGLTSLSDAAAESLSRHEGKLYLRLNNLPASAAEILRQHPSFQGDE